MTYDLSPPKRTSVAFMIKMNYYPLASLLWLYPYKSLGGVSPHTVPIRIHMNNLQKIIIFDAVVLA